MFKLIYLHICRVVVLKHQLDKKDYAAHYKGGESQKLGHPQSCAEEIQTIGAEALDETTAKAIPGQIHEEQLAVKLAVFF